MAPRGRPAATLASLATHAGGEAHASTHEFVAAARRGTFKGIVPFHSIADHQKLARTGGPLWCHEVASDV